MVDVSKTLGLFSSEQDSALLQRNLNLYIALKLASSGQPIHLQGESVQSMSTAEDMLRSFVEKADNWFLIIIPQTKEFRILFSVI